MPGTFVTDVALAKLTTKYGGSKSLNDYIVSDWAPAQSLAGFPAGDALKTFLAAKAIAIPFTATGWLQADWRAYWDNVTL